MGAAGISRRVAELSTEDDELKRAESPSVQRSEALSFISECIKCTTDFSETPLSNENPSCAHSPAVIIFLCFANMQ